MPAPIAGRLPTYLERAHAAQSCSAVMVFRAGAVAGLVTASKIHSAGRSASFHVLGMSISSPSSPPVGEKAQGGEYQQGDAAGLGNTCHAEPNIGVLARRGVAAAVRGVQVVVVAVRAALQATIRADESLIKFPDVTALVERAVWACAPT